MKNRVEYARDTPHVAIVNNDIFDKVTPFWVYYNNKIASKFASKHAAREYVKILLREG